MMAEIARTHTVQVGVSSVLYRIEVRETFILPLIFRILHRLPINLLEMSPYPLPLYVMG